MARIFGIIPARYYSTRFPGKPLASIAGRPMIQHVYTRARSCPDLFALHVATDDRRILECVEAFGGQAVMTSPEHASGTDRIAEAAALLGVRDDDIVINIQGDQPLFRPAIVPLLVAPLLREPETAMTTLKRPMAPEENPANPNHVKVVTDREGFALYFSRHPIPFARDAASSPRRWQHLGIYGYRGGFLREFTRLPPGRLEGTEKLEQLRALENGYRIKVLETSFAWLEVDVPGDVGGVESLLQAGVD